MIKKIGKMNTKIIKKRHLIVTIFLYLAIVASFVMTVTYFRTAYIWFSRIGTTVNIDGVEQSCSITSSNVVYIASHGLYYLTCVLFSILLLKWKKFAFWGFVGTSVLGTILYLIFIGYYPLTVDPTVHITIISVAVLWAILQIRKNGVSCWKNLK